MSWTWFRKKVRPVPGEAVGDRAGRFYDAGHNCAQSVLQATTGIDDPQMLDLCDAFGGGIGDTKCLCGAVSGGVVALSLSGKKKYASRLVEDFKARHRTTCCKGLTAAFEWRSDAHLANCRDLTAETAEAVTRLLTKR